MRAWRRQLLAVLLSGLAGAATADAPRVSVVDGEIQLKLDSELSGRLGIESATLVPATYVPESEVSGVVVAADELRAAHDAARRRATERRFLIDLAATHSEQVARLDQQREAGAALAVEARYAARVAAVETSTHLAMLDSDAAAAADALESRWGRQLAAAALDQDGMEFGALAAGDRVLLRIDLGTDTTGAGLPPRLDVAADGVRSHALEAELVGPAPRGTRWGGRSVWALAPATLQLPAGARISAWLPTAPPRSGVRIPREATVWSSGQRWIYVRIGAEMFARRAVDARATPDGDFFSAASELSGREVVVRGAQALLAEELRWSIPDEDDD
jgi:hypothetical protein